MAEPALGNAPEPSRLDLPGMSLLEHLEELRRRIIYSLISIIVAFGLAWGYAEDIFRLMERPIHEALRANGLAEKLVYTNPTDPFNIYLRIALIAGLFLASPVILYQFWMFISPGLYRHEKRYVLPFMFVTVGLFLAG
ncbi:MAG: twin-arginine translocase subunit TatC, partial [Terriglobales bacterium]